MRYLWQILFGVSIMPIRRRRVARKPKRRAPMKKRGARKGAKRTTDYAKCVEIQETTLVSSADRNGQAVGAVMNFCLQDFQRPQEIAHAFKYYRASFVEITFIPYSNLSQIGGAAPTRLPQLYMSIDRLSNRWIAPTENECLERGISPRLFTKKMSLRFKPNLLQGISLETSQPRDGTGAVTGITNTGYQNAIPVFNKWLPTQQSFGYNTNGANPPNQTNLALSPLGVNPYALRYHGAIFNAAVEGLASGVSLDSGDIQVKVTWEFKGPRALSTNSPLPEPNPYFGTSSQTADGTPLPNTQPTTYP